MTRDDIIRMAREAGVGRWDAQEVAIERFATLVAEGEREECAKMCETKMPQPVVNWSDAQIVEALRDCAAAIRARSSL